MRYFICFLILTVSLIAAEQKDLDVSKLVDGRESRSSALMGLNNPFSIKKEPIATVIDDNGNAVEKSVEAEPEMVLKAVLNENCMINDSWYGIDEELFGYRVSKIEDNIVELQRKSDNKRKVLTMLESSKVEVVKK